MVSGAWISLFWATVPIHVLIGFGIPLKQIREPILGSIWVTLGLFWELVGIFGFKKGFRKRPKRDQNIQDSVRMFKKCFERTQDEQSWGKMGYTSNLVMVSGA